MNKLLPLILAAVTLTVISSCSGRRASQQPMPGMSAQEHANMKKGSGSMSGMKM